MRTDPAVNGGQPFYYQQDHEGSTTHLTNAAGTVIEKYRYDAFGLPTYMNGSGVVIGGSAYTNRFLFTGREYRSTFGFYEYRARAYHPILGRFMSEDPKLFDAGDYNLFRYCHNDPEDLTDPMGLTDIDISPQMYGQIWQASVHSYNVYKAAGDGIGRSQYVIQRVDSQGNPAGKTFLQTNRDGSPTINKSNIVQVPREEYKQYRTGQPYRYVEQETGDAGKGFRAAASGHVHADKTGHGMPQWSDYDRDAARGTKDHQGRPIGRIDESNPGVMKVLVPQVEGGEPKERTFSASQVEQMAIQNEAAKNVSNILHDSNPKPR